MPLRRFLPLTAMAFATAACGARDHADVGASSADLAAAPACDDPLSGCGEYPTEFVPSTLVATNADTADGDGDGVAAPFDCNDGSATAYPLATELPCNGVDEDCDGVDLCLGDLDGDGSPAPLDCDDADPDAHWGAPEVSCNGWDEDCDGFDWCDADADGLPASFDCNDADADVHQGAPEIPCDGIDQDCRDGDCCGEDLDGDGVECGTDCDDRDPRRHPGAADPCDTYDEDCDGEDGVAGVTYCPLL